MTLARSVARQALLALVVLTILVLVLVAMGVGSAATDGVGSWRWFVRPA
ncbi:MAG: hypothetical protein ABWY52_06590 [Candidatus Limnocylindrales bacterium]